MFRLLISHLQAYFCRLSHKMLCTILNSVRQHNHFITQGNYKATCFDYRLVILRPIFQLCHKMLCTIWDPIVFTSMEYIKLNRWDPKVCIASCDSIDKNRPEDD